MKLSSIPALLLPLLFVSAPFLTARAVADGEIFVTEQAPYTPSYVGAYTTSGATVSSVFASSSPSGAYFGVAASASDVYISNFNQGTIDEFTTLGSLVHQPLARPGSSLGLAASGNDLYAGVNGSDSVAEVNATTGAENPTFISLVTSIPDGIAVSGNDLYVISYGNPAPGSATYTVGEYNATTGAPINASLVVEPTAYGSNNLNIAISGNDLFVAGATGTVSEYNATTGAVINSSLITGLSDEGGIAAYRGDLYIVLEGTAGDSNGAIAEYATSGTPISSSLVGGLYYPYAIAIVPEPSTWVMLVIGSVALLASGLRKRRSASAS